MELTLSPHFHVIAFTEQVRQPSLYQASMAHVSAPLI